MGIMIIHMANYRTAIVEHSDLLFLLILVL